MQHTPTHEPPQHIIWDWNGTLQNDVMAAVNGINLLLQQRNLPTVTLEEHRQQFVFPVHHYYTALGFQLEQENWQQLSHDFITAFLADPSTQLFDATVSTLQHLHDCGIPMSVISLAEQNTLERALIQHQIRHYFQQVKGLDNHGAASKVHLAKALFQELNLNPQTTWFIGDTTHDKEVADAVHCHCLLLTSGYQSVQRLQACHCPLLSSLEQIPAFFGL